MPKLLERYDLVEACGSRFIIIEVHPNRPANPYVAIKERGNGAKYKLGHKHYPRKIGTVSSTHHMLDQTAIRDFDRLGSDAKQILRDALTAVVSGDTNAKEKAKNILNLLN